ncbi:hypothetical protein PFISCL1PPCAC_1554, partial [Pristionchus fissidentatus]
GSYVQVSESESEEEEEEDESSYTLMSSSRRRRARNIIRFAFLSVVVMARIWANGVDLSVFFLSRPTNRADERWGNSSATRWSIWSRVDRVGIVIRGRRGGGG